MSCMIMLLSSINNMAPKSNFNIIFNCMTFLQQKNKWNSFKGVFLIVNDDSSVGFKGTVTRFCACAATWFLSGGQFFKIGVLVKKSSSIDPETPEKAIISVFKSYLVHLGSFKRYILYFCASIIEKIRSHWGKPYEAKFVVVSVPTNGSNVAFNVVIWLSFLSIKVLQSTIYLWRIFFKR